MNNEKLQKWALVAEICGGIGVIATLILLILETQENTQVMRAAAYDSIQADIAGWRQNNISDNELVEIGFLFETEGFDGLTPRQQFIFERRAVIVFQHYERAFIQWQLGNLTDSTWERFRGLLCPPPEGGSPELEERIETLLDSVTTYEFSNYRKNECGND